MAVAAKAYLLGKQITTKAQLKTLGFFLQPDGELQVAEC
jgi:hypothetical protein